MLLLIHIVLALGGLVLSTLAMVAPSHRKIQGSIALLAGTLSSGTYLVWQTHASVTSACTSGLLYVAVTTGLLLVARHRLATQIN